MLFFGTLDVENLVNTIINNPKLTSKAWKVTTRLARVGVPRMDQNMIPLSTPNMDHLFKSLDILDLYKYIYIYTVRIYIYINTFCVPESALRCQVMFPPSTPAPCPLATCCYGARCDRRKHPPCFFFGLRQHGSYGPWETDVAMGNRHEDRTCRRSQTHPGSSCLGWGYEIPGWRTPDWIRVMPWFGHNSDHPTLKLQKIMKNCYHTLSPTAKVILQNSFFGEPHVSVKFGLHSTALGTCSVQLGVG